MALGFTRRSTDGAVKICVILSALVDQWNVAATTLREKSGLKIIRESAFQLVMDQKREALVMELIIASLSKVLLPRAK